MLVLTRRIGESIIIGDGEITLTIYEVNGRQVKFGIDAPRSIRVDREEVFKRRKAQQKKAENNER